jgi:hypothetical protein
MKQLAFISALFLSLAATRLGAQELDSAWVIKGGTFDGKSIPIDRARATRKSSHFWRTSSTKGDPRIVGWNPSTLPAKIAFRNSRTDAADSAAFWSIVRQMERDMGMHLFEPASLAAEADDENIIVVDLKPMMGSEGVTYITWSLSGAPYDARVYLGSRSLLHDARVVTHELMHALGFGHTTAWDSVMNPGPSGPGSLTAQDVAYAQAAFESRATIEREDMWARLALAASREDRTEEYGNCADVITSRTVGQSARAGLPIEDPLRSSSCFR